MGVTAVDVEYVASQLPVEPDDGIRAFVRKNWHELGGFVTLFRRVSAKSIGHSYYGEPMRGYVGECWCSECGSTWHTAWQDGSIVVADGDDGMIYPISSDAAEYGADLVSAIGDGQTGVCPCCGEGVTFRRASKFGARQMTRRMFLVFRCIGKYTALVSWLACREIYPDRRTCFELVPWVANVIDEQGRLRAFRFHGDEGRWRRACGPVTPETTGYVDGRNCSYGYSRGGFIELPAGDLAGETGEKTGLCEYLASRGCYPTNYLRILRKHRCIENLMKSGFSGIAAKMVDYYASGYGLRALELLDLTKAKPHEIACVSKTDFRVICRDGWNDPQYKMFREALATGLVADAAEFSGFWPLYKWSGIRMALNLQKDEAGMAMAKISRYLERQGLLPDDLHHLVDYRSMFRKVHLVPPQSAEELWPRNLLDAHDQLAMLISVQGSTQAQAAFARTAETLSPLIWTDGELCIVIPSSPAALKHEGRVLRHCVGGYADSHVSGKPVFFVRHRRRPERPYYTLNINLQGDAPKRIQLHGYGNERHGDKKQYTHSIPKKVLAFCDRWEREVLAPFWAEHIKQKQEVIA